MTGGDLAVHERRIAAAIRAGEAVELHPEDPPVRAELLADLLTEERPGRPRPLRLTGARITGPLDLEGATLTSPLHLQDCQFDGPVNLDETTAPSIRLPGCRLPALSARRLHTTGNLELTDGFTADGEVTLLRARIGGRLALGGATVRNSGGRALNADRLTVEQGISARGLTAEGEVRLLAARIEDHLDLNGARLSNPGGTALQANWLTVGLYMLCSDGFTAEGAINLASARIPRLDLSGATLSCPDGRALNGYGLAIEQDLDCRAGFTAEGEVNLIGAQIGGLLYLDGARLANPDGAALYADVLTVGQSLFARDGFDAAGEVRLAGARIGGVCDLKGARLSNPGLRALVAIRLRVEGDLLLRDGFRARGVVQLAGAAIGGRLELDQAQLDNPGGTALGVYQLDLSQTFSADGLTAQGLVQLDNARIGGQLELDGARLSNPGGVALSGDSLVVDQDMLCREGFTAEGELRLTGADVQTLDLSRARLSHPGGWALSGLGLKVTRNVFCRNGFTAEGVVRFVGAEIGGRLSFIDAQLAAGQGYAALDLELARAGALILRPGQPPQGAVDLTNARVGAFWDDQATWPDEVLLRGFSYERFEHDEAPVRARLRWMARQLGEYAPQPYDQLAGAYRQDGREEAARQAAIAKHWHRRQALNPVGKLANWLLYVTVGYGYRTWLAAVWLAGLLAVGTLVFGQAEMSRVDSNAPAFKAFAYTADVLLPIVDLGQQRAWQPEGGALYVAWGLIAAGWVLTTAVVLGLSQHLRKD